MIPNTFRSFSLRGRVLCSMLLVMAASHLSSGPLSGKEGGSEEPIVLGAPLSTAYLYGWTAHKNLVLAAEEINRGGGVMIGGKGRPFKVEVIDTRDLEPGVPVAEALLAVEKLILERGADVIIGGPVRSEAALAAMDLLARHRKVSILTTGALTPKYHKRVAEDYDRYKYLFRITSEVLWLSKEAVDIFESIRKNHGFSSVYIMVQDVSHARAMGDLLKERLKGSGWKVMGHDIYPTGTADYSMGLLKAKSTGAKVLFIWMDHPETSILLKQYNDLKVPALPITGICSAAEQPGAWAGTEGKIEYAIVCPANAGNAESDATEWTMRYFEAHKKRWLVEPEGYGASSSYMGVYVLKDAIERAGSLDPDALVSALEKTDMMGVYGRIRFDPKSHQVIPDYDPKMGAVGTWFQWLAGKRVVVWPPTIKRSDIKLPPWLIKSGK